MAIYNVMTGYGAANNNTTNDATSINNAIAAANAAGGGIVYFPAGAGYKVNSTLTTLGAGVTLEGEGWKRSVIRANFATGNVVNFGTGATGGGEMNAVKFLGFDPMVTRTSGAEIAINQGLSTYVEEVKVMNVSGRPYVGIRYYGGSGYKQYLTRSEVNGAVSGLEVGTYGSTDNPINIFVFESEFSACEGSGVAVFGGFVVFRDTECLTNQQHGWVLVPSQGQGANVELHACLADTNGQSGVRLTDNGGTCSLKGRSLWSSNNGNINNNGNYSGPHHGVWVETSNCGLLDIQGGHFPVNGGDGIHAFGTSAVIIKENMVEHNSLYSPGTYSGIYIRGSSRNAQVDGNYVDGTSSQGFGIATSAGLVGLNAIRNNMCVNNTTNYSFGTTPTVAANNV